MSRKLLFLSLLLLASIASAGTIHIERHPEVAAPATVGGIVESVGGNVIQLANGLVSIDATGAKIVIGRGHEGTLADIRPGMLLFAVLSRHDVAANAPLPARVITATRFHDATFFGPVQSVDLSASTFTLLGRTIRVTPDTSFGGRKSDSSLGLDDVHANDIVQVEADATGGQLVATSVLVLAPVPPTVGSTRGTVKSIGTDSWVIERKPGDELTLVINAQTKIIGSPKVGDTVEVLYTVDSSHQYVAVSIVKFEKPSPPDVVTHFSGKVSTIDGQIWTVTKTGGEPVKFSVNDKTKIEPGIHVGDDVDVGAVRRDDGTLLAILIVKMRR